MHQKPVILTDCDNVLLNWFANIPFFLMSKGFPIDHLQGKIEGNQFFDHKELFSTDCEDTSFSRLMEYNTSTFVSTLPAMEVAALEVLPRLSDIVDIIVVTNISDNPISKQYRTQNLRSIYGDVFSDIICLNPHSDKSKSIKQIAAQREVILWTDDRVEHVKEGIKAGVPSYQYTYDMHCGRNTGEVDEINSWREIELKVKQVLGINADSH